MKKIVALIISLSCCLSILGLNISAFDILNTNYAGTYYMVGVFNSWITVRTGGCDVHIVYDRLENTYISATGGSGYLNDNYFLSSYNAYMVVDQSGNKIRNLYEPTSIQGSVTVDKNSKYIDINIDGMIYEKSFGSD